MERRTLSAPSCSMYRKGLLTRNVSELECGCHMLKIQPGWSSDEVMFPIREQGEARFPRSKPRLPTSWMSTCLGSLEQHSISSKGVSTPLKDSLPIWQPMRICSRVLRRALYLWHCMNSGSVCKSLLRKALVRVNGPCPAIVQDPIPVRL